MASANDQRVTSVTYRVPYPQSAITINATTTSKEVRNQDLIFLKKWSEHLEGFHFVECRVKYDGNVYKEKAYVSKTKFIKCSFSKSFLGGTLYENVTFTNCHFTNCDFYNSTFKNCNFTGCSFENSTAWLVDFQNTVISAVTFMSGICFPVANYTGTDKVTLAKHIHSHHKTCLDIACNLIKSAAETYDSSNIDLAIYAHKLELHSYYKAKLSYNWKTLKFDEFGKMGKMAKDIPKIFSLKIINLMSDGGTSLSKIVWFSLLVVFIFAPGLLYYFTNVSLKMNDVSIPLREMNYPLLVASSVEAVMGFGYDSLTPSSITDKYLLITLPVTGFFLFAFFVHALIKKVFR